LIILSCQLHKFFNKNIYYFFKDKLSKSTPAICNALEIGRQGDLYNYENKLEICLDNYKMALSILVPLLNNEPSGLRKDLLHQQVLITQKQKNNEKLNLKLTKQKILII